MYYEKHVFVCENIRPPGSRICCGTRGGKEVREYLKQRLKELAPKAKIRVNMSGCLDRCEEGPAVVCYPQGSWFRLRNKEDAEDWLQNYLLQETVDLSQPALKRIKLPDQPLISK